MRLKYSLVSWPVFLLLSALPETLSATTIVIIKTKSEIFAGADSKATAILGGHVSSQCKIRHIDQFFIASAGIYQTGSGRLNIEKLVTDIHRKGEPISKTVSRADSMIANALSHAIRDAKQNDHLYRELLAGNVLTYFFGFEDHLPVLYGRRFRVYRNRDYGTPLSVIEGDHEDCVGNCSHRERFVAFMGGGAIGQFASKNPGFVNSGEPTDVIKTLISFDIHENPTRSGHPIDILRIDATGGMWIQKKAGC